MPTMNTATHSHRLLSNLLLAAIVVTVASAAAATALPADDPPREAAATAPAEPPDTSDAPDPNAEAEKAKAAEMADTWGIEVTSIRLTANDHMIDFRYRVLDPEKAKDLFVRQTKPALIHQKTGKVLAVPETAKIGPLRNSNAPQEGKIYWMFFGNAGYLVQAGDKVTVVIGDFRVEDLVVE